MGFEVELHPSIMGGVEGPSATARHCRLKRSGNAVVSGDRLPDMPALRGGPRDCRLTLAEIVETGGAVKLVSLKAIC